MEKCLVKHVKERNIGIDMLRIISMLMVVILHVIGHGGILENTNVFSLNNEVINLLKYLSLGAVNLYAIITGFVCLKSKHRWERIIEMWFQVFFYTFGISIISYIFMNNIVNISIKDIIKAMFPVITKYYWYFTAYFALFFAIPFLNILINNINKKQHKFIIIIGLFLFCIISIKDVFGIEQGYSFLWLVYLYVIGAYLKLYSDDFKQRNVNYLCLFIINIFIIFISDILISIITFKIFGAVKYNNIFAKYNSIFMVFATISLFLFFSRLEIKYFKNAILKIASVSFGVYLISDNFIMRKFIIDNKFVTFANMPWYQMLCYTIIVAIIIYVVCSIIDYIRKKIFELIKIHKLSEKVVEIIKNVYSKCGKIINKI